jgi:hypothetical protein
LTVTHKILHGHGVHQEFHYSLMVIGNGKLS